MRTKSLISLVCITAVVGCTTPLFDSGERLSVSSLGIAQARDGRYVVCGDCPTRTMKTPWRNLGIRSAAGNGVPRAAKSISGRTPSTINLSGTQSSFTTGSDVNDRTESSKNSVASGVPLLVLRFPFDAASVQPEHRQQLDDFAAETRPEMKNRSLTVVGFTDDTGPQCYNDILARRRAESVAKVLRALGVDALHTRAKGKCCYVSDNDTPQGRADNRRVEIHLSFNHENTRSRADED